MEHNQPDSIENHPIKLREAQPTLEQGRLFAGYLNTAAEGFFRFMLGKNYLDILTKAYLLPDNDLSYQHVTFAVKGDNIIGMISSFTAQAHKNASPRVLTNAAGLWNLRFRVVSILFWPLIRALDTIKDGDFYLQAIAVDSHVRGKRVGSMLLDHTEALAIDNEADRIALDVSASNDHAFQIYKSRGYVVDSTWPRHVRIPAIMFSRMSKKIESCHTKK